MGERDAASKGGVALREAVRDGEQSSAEVALRHGRYGFTVADVPVLVQALVRFGSDSGLIEAASTALSTILTNHGEPAARNFHAEAGYRHLCKAVLIHPEKLFLARASLRALLQAASLCPQIVINDN